jgi:hypothetical protein
MTFTHGATAATETHHPHRLGNVLRAAKVIVTTALGVILLGEYDEEAGVQRRSGPYRPPPDQGAPTGSADEVHRQGLGSPHAGRPEESLG